MVKFFKTSLLYGLLIVLSSALPQWAAAQSRVVSGTVKDEKGTGLPGVTIIVKGTAGGTTSMADGQYSVKVSAGDELEFSFIGYASQTVRIGAQSVVDITLQEQSLLAEEVVVTAYAVQKKVNVTGSISQVKGTDLVATPVANISNALIGNTPGVSGLQTSGEPGHNAANIRIRGISTYGSASPLIVIDGVEQPSEQAMSELNAMDANEIQDISVLKDASSTAVYGIRGANGVIIVTTRRGNTGAPTVNFSMNYGFTRASNFQKGTSSYEYALLRNEAIRNEQRSFAGTESLSTYIFDDYDLWKFKNNRDYTPVEVDAKTNLSAEKREQLKKQPALYYANRDLYKEMFDRNAPQMQVNLNVAGGTQRVKYFVSFGYFSQAGITRDVHYHDANTGSKFNRYNFRSNFDISVAKNWKISINTAGQFGETQGLGSGSDPYDLSSRYKSIMQYIYEGNPFISPGMIDGRLVNGFAGTAGSEQNPLAVKTGSQLGSQNAIVSLLTAGTNSIFNSLLDNTIKLEHTMDYLLDGLRIYGTVNYQDNYNRIVKYKPSIPTYSVQRNPNDPTVLDFFGGGMGAGSFESWGYSNWNKLYLDAGIDWHGSFNGHNVSGLVLAKASRYTMPGDSYNVASGVMGFVGRVTYNYKDRYMAEVNVGYNGTEQFARGRRFGWFPAYSIGWVPTSEKFFPENDILTFLKIRASYGEVGNDQLGGNRRFYYLPNTYNLNQGGYWLGNSDGSSQNPYWVGATEGVIGNPDITWERAKKYDVGIEARFFRNRLSLVADWFREDRRNILTTLGTIPIIYGVSSDKVPPVNVGITKNQGYELLLSWEDQIGNWRYSLSGDVSYSRNKIVYKAEAENPYPWMNQTGFSIGQRFGLVSDGFFNTNEELANRPYNTYTANRATLGDIRYVDLNGDGLIDNKDIAPIGYPNYPEYHFNVKASVGWKGFDLRVLFIGTANGSYYLNSGYTMPFFKRAGNAWKWMYDGRWTAERYAAGKKITFPRMTFDTTSSDNNYLTSDFWMKSSNFFKIKNIELGYTFDMTRGRLARSRIRALRVYFNANNVYTFKNELTDIGIDPETTDGSTYIYPLTSVFSFGINLKF